MNKLCLFLFCAIPYWSKAQQVLETPTPPGSSGNFTYSIYVDEVDFIPLDPYPESKIKIIRDVFPNLPISGPAWKYPNIENPVGFTSGRAIQVTAKFKLSGCSKVIWAKGDGPGGYDPPAQNLVQGVYFPIPLPIDFPANKVDFYDPFEIRWYVSNSPDGPWIEAGISRNPMYILYRSSPIPSSIPVFHSLIYYGCKNAKGLSDTDNIVDNIYTKTFGGRAVPRKDQPTKSAMSYWAWPDPVVQQMEACYFKTIDLLKWENGRCGAWANFFYDMIQVQGISGAAIATVTYNNPSIFNLSVLTTDINSFFGASSTLVNVNHNLLPYGQFFVNNFTLNQNKFYTWDREWMPLGTSTSPINLPNGNVLAFAPAIGAPGQGNNNPMSTFVDHAIVKYNNKYYDPSYGTSISSKNSWENSSLSGFGTGIALTYTYPLLRGIQSDIHVMWLAESNTPLLQSTINP